MVPSGLASSERIRDAAPSAEWRPLLSAFARVLLLASSLDSCGPGTGLTLSSRSRSENFELPGDAMPMT